MELEKIQKKLNALERQFSKLIVNQGANTMAILAILKEEGLLNDGRRFEKLADQYKQDVKFAHKYADFQKLMRKFGRMRYPGKYPVF